jgi:hypothetical protein
VIWPAVERGDEPVVPLVDLRQALCRRSRRVGDIVGGTAESVNGPDRAALFGREE